MKRTIRLNRDAMNAMLPPIPSDFEQSMRDMIFAMPAERKDTPMKRKISFGLILALVLTLLAVSALAAAFLGGKDFVDQIVAPKAAESRCSGRILPVAGLLTCWSTSAPRMRFRALRNPASSGFTEHSGRESTGRYTSFRTAASSFSYAS